MRRLVHWRGRTSREVAARRARHLRAQLGVAADIAIAAQRKTLAARLEAVGADGAGERLLRGRVNVDDVLEYARQHFALTSATREQAAAVLRTRYELRGGHRDLDTDAYSRAAGSSAAAAAGEEAGERAG
ncbi:hypothetical protein [Streptomyces sp. AC555_RSS877]|uniref:hypothetical protein n=1 Tax=Streptomyces sp. AC555_RSS877 TaxID=2823688 RepID=UPI001C276BA4|nr:hypothetical protein [Streptomyces sp. AC555_RSS877]